MFYRRKILLALLQLFDGQLDKIRLQKLLFLFANKQVKADYDFVPYKLGCYSYSANADMSAMVGRGLVSDTGKYFVKSDTTDYLKQLKTADLKTLQEVKSFYGKMSANTLMKYTYINFPFFATRSEVARQILTNKEFESVVNSKVTSNKTVLFTIGYEGISLEEYLVRLLKNGIKVLVDVRNNPLSMKSGFSKSQLKNYCTSVGVDYVHIPEVGIQSELRQELNSQSDYDRLFDFYRKYNLPQTTGSQLFILNLLTEHKRIALSCFEADICRCHRKHLAETIEKLPGFSFEVVHL